MEEPKVVAESVKPKSTAETRTLKLTDLFKTEKKKEADEVKPEVLNRAFTQEELQSAWQEFAESKKAFQLEYHLLSQPFEHSENAIRVHVTNLIEESTINSVKQDLVDFLRKKLGNSFIQIQAVMQQLDEKKIIYTNKDKYEFMAEKNPLLRELKDRLGLDTDF